MTSSASGRPTELDDDGFPDDFRDFIHSMNSCDVEYVLVGGYAVGVYGHIRATADIDFLYRRSAENVRRLLRALEQFGAPDIVLDEAHLGRADSVTAFGAPPTRIDLLSTISGVSFEEAVVQATHIVVSGHPLRVIGLSALRKNKGASGRKKDRDDLRRLPGTSSGA